MVGLTASPLISSCARVEHLEVRALLATDVPAWTGDWDQNGGSTMSGGATIEFTWSNHEGFSALFGFLTINTSTPANPLNDS